MFRFSLFILAATCCTATTVSKPGLEDSGDGADSSPELGRSLEDLIVAMTDKIKAHNKALTSDKVAIK